MFTARIRHPPVALSRRGGQRSLMARQRADDPSGPAPAGGDRCTREGAAGTAAPLVPPQPTLATLREASATCRACDLWERGTQTVFGEGAPGADVVFVGEQPGDREDREGHPFVGPAGRLLERAIAEAGLDRRRIYITNVVKHFKWEPRGKRRIHQKPNATEIRACRPWLDAELAVVRPRAVVCLGATAAQAVLGKDFKVTKHRGQPRPGALAPIVMGTVHPSSILRAPDDDARRAEMEGLVADLVRLRAALDGLARSASADGEPVSPP
jgi:uracil-DNA glycosylase